MRTDNVITGGAGNDTVVGGAGNDTFIATVGDGNDSYNGGAGTDTYDLSATTADATVNLNLTTAQRSSLDIGTDILTFEHDRERDRRRRQRHHHRKRVEQCPDRRRRQ